MEDGQYRQRRLWHGQLFGRILSWRLSFEQAQLFEAWLEYDVSRGVGWFDVPFLSGTIRVRPTNGVPTYSFQSGYWVVTLDVTEVQSGPVIPVSNALPLWPQEFPQLERDGYTLAQTGAVTVSDINAGLPQMRVRFRDRVAFYSGQVILSATQLEQFWSFYRNDLINGNAWFMAPFASPDTQELRKARFTASPTEAPNGSYFNVTLALETVNLPIMSKEEYKALTPPVFTNDYYVDGYIEDGYIGQYV